MKNKLKRTIDILFLANTFVLAMLLLDLFVLLLLIPLIGGGF